MDRKWMLLEKYLDNELNAGEMTEFTAMLKNDKELKEELAFQQSLETGIKCIEIPDIESRKQIIMKKIMLSKPAKKSIWGYIIPPVISYALVSTIFAVYSLRGYIIDSLWPQFGSFFVKATFYADKVIVVFKELPLVTISLIIAGPAISMLLFSFLIPMLYKKIINKEAINENIH